jgi:hypothetical protein
VDKKKEYLDEKHISEEYLEYQKVFSEEAKCLLPLWVEDISIMFKEGALEQLDCKVYPLSQKELAILWKTLDNNIIKEYIQYGIFLFVFPIFFIPKKDREELCMVIDYWKLNDITKKDFYPLPNLWMELEKLSKYHLFFKFDVRVGYNNIHIKEQDWYKAAFKTLLETFIPTVMTFKFCNTLLIFQRAMN